MISWTCHNIHQSLTTKSNAIKTPEPVSTSVKNNCVWILENPLELDSSQLLLTNGLTCYLMYTPGDQMLNQVVKDDRDHDSWV